MDDGGSSAVNGSGPLIRIVGEPCMPRVSAWVEVGNKKMRTAASLMPTAASAV